MPFSAMIELCELEINSNRATNRSKRFKHSLNKGQRMNTSKNALAPNAGRWNVDILPTLYYFLLFMNKPLAVQS